MEMGPDYERENPISGPKSSPKYSFVGNFVEEIV